MKKNFEELTVVVLKEQAKALGIKNYSKMRKAELVEALKTIEENINGDVKMNNNKELSNNKLNEKEVVNMNKLNNRLAQLIKEGNVDGIAKTVGRRNSKAFKMIKETSKDMKVIGSYQVIFRVDYKEEYDTKTPYLVVDLAVNVGLGSNITRAAMTKYMKIADNSMVLNIEGTTEVVSINLDNSLFQETQNKQLAKQLEEIRIRVFSMLKGGDISKVNRETLNIVFSENGLARVEFNEKAKIKENEIMKQYKFLGISPSGLRSKSFQAASVKIKTFNNDFMNCDRRTYLLNESVDGCMDKFMDENGFKDLKSKAAQFKNSTRITMGTPGSKVIGEISNMIVFENIAEGAKFNNKDASKTCDGNTIACAEYAHKRLVESGVPVSLSDVVGICEQVRGAGLKASTIYELREDLVTLIRHLLSSESEAKVSYVIVDGIRYSSWKEVCEADKAKEFFNNVELIADENAMKITTHRNRFNLVRLKTAYQSNMNLSMVTAMSMLFANEEKASKLLLNKSIYGIAKKFRQLGIKFEYEDGMINGVELDLEGLKALNNESQFMTYLLKCDPKKTIAMFPGVIRSEFANIIKGIAKTISKAEIELENSSYTVVQADKGVIFGTQILDEHEMFCHSLPSNVEVAITRHPISALNAVTILRTVSLEEIIKRILATDLSIDKKMFLINYYGRANQWCIIPASHRLMEKHDGMDFDIDAVQIIVDQDVVEILKELKDRGSVIKENKKADEDRHTETPEEKAISAAQKNHNLSFNRPEVIKSERTTKTINTSSRIMINRKKSSNRKYDLSFDSICSLSKEYYSTTIANVGVIANAFYVNGLILSTLKSKSVDIKVKEAINKAFKMYYKCNGAEEYVSTIDRNAEIYEVEKKDCSDSVFRFAESNGSLNSLISYLEDCCDYNRYLAETSIDSAKNNFFIINMFNHGKIVSPKGAKQNCKAILKEGNETFAEIANRNNENENNFFELNLLQFESKGLELNEWLECDGMQINPNNGEMTQVALAVEDALYLIKEESRIVANELIVLSSKLLEEEILSDYAIELRNSISIEASKLIDGKSVLPVIDSISKSYATLTLALKENNKDEKTSDEIEGISKVEYLKTVAINGIKNFARHALSDLKSIEIGAIICNELVKGVSNENCKAINSAFYKIFDDEIVEFLSEYNFDNVGFIGEEISYAHVDSTKINVKDFVGTIISVNDGQAEIENTIIVMKNKRTSITGSIVEINGRFFVKAIRENSEVVNEHGMYLNVNKKFDKYCVDTSNMDIVGYRFKAKHDNVHLGIYAYDSQNNEYLVAAVSGRKDITEILKNANLSNISIMTHTSEKGYTSKVVYLPGVDFINAIDSMNNCIEDNEMFNMNFDINYSNEEYSFNLPSEEFVATDLEVPTFDFDFKLCD